MRHSSTRLILAWMAIGSGALAMAPTPGCSSHSNQAAPQDAAVDSGGDDAGAIACAGDPPRMQWVDPSGQLQDPDWSCYEPDATFAAPIVFDDAAADAPGAGDADGAPPDDAAEDGFAEAGALDASTDAAATFQQDTFQLTDFIAHTPVPDAVVDVFFGNTLSGGASPDFTATTLSDDSMPPGYGSFFMPYPPGQVFAYRVRQRTSTPGLSTLVQFDNLTPARGTTFPGNSITTAVVQTLLAGVLGTSETVPGSATVITGARDCASHELVGGVLRLIDDATSQPVATGTGPTDVQENYFGPDDLPHAECTHTIAVPIALWGAVNVPADRALRLQLWGRMHPGDAQPVLVGERKLELYANDIVIARAYRLTPNQ
jgi:hypothetical protein